MVSTCQRVSEKFSLPDLNIGMSSYLPMRHGTTGREELHGSAAEGASYMDHFLNIPEICPTGTDYRSRGYYMGSYQAEACRMEALQQHRSHELSRMGARASYFQNMNVPGNLRFRDPCGPEGLSATGTTNNNKNEPISPCSTGTPGATSEGETPPSFYPWMSIVG